MRVSEGKRGVVQKYPVGKKWSATWFLLNVPLISLQKKVPQTSAGLGQRQACYGCPLTLRANLVSPPK